MASLQQNLQDFDNYTKEKQLRKELEDIDEQEDEMWKQKSRVKWAMKGDRNTKFFQVFTINRRMRSKITRIKKMDGTWAEEKSDIVKEFAN